LALFAAFAFFISISAHAADAKNITVDQAEKVIKSDANVVVLDVRTPKEFQAGHIKGATNINFMDKEFAKKMESLDKSKTYVIHCQGGGRSWRACEQIKTMDFKNMLHMNEGFGAWEKAGKPVEK
jgi:rhodanese-related sulfurtransferase